MIGIHPADEMRELVADALSASELVGETEGQRAWLASKGSPYAAPGVSDGLVMAAFIAHCCIMLRKLAEAVPEQACGTDAGQAAWEAACDAAWWETCGHMAAAGLLGPDAYRNLRPDVATSSQQARGISVNCANGCHAPLCSGCSCDCH